jgi:hypothetical protein
VFLTTDFSYYLLIFGRALLAEHFKLETRDQGLREGERWLFSHMLHGKEKVMMVAVPDIW